MLFSAPDCCHGKIYFKEFANDKSFVAELKSSYCFSQFCEFMKNNRFICLVQAWNIPLDY